jgi:hypothetical protein
MQVNKKDNLMCTCGYFDDYIKQESLEGDNKYDAGDYGLQVK